MPRADVATLITEEWLNNSVISLGRIRQAPCARPTSARMSCCSAGCHQVRDLGSLLFIDVRDRDGHTQVVVEGNDELLERAKRLRSEYVVAVLGRVERRSPETTNAERADRRGRSARRARCASSTKPGRRRFPISEDANVSEEIRLKYRYLDLRRPRLQTQHRPAPPHHAGAAGTTSTSRASGKSRRRS